MAGDDERSQQPRNDDDAWIERVVGLAGHLGFNKMRLRWKLLRWQDQRRKAANQRQQLVTHIRYAHKTCPECGAIHDRDELACTRCQTKLGSHRLQVLQRIGLAAPVPISMSTLLALAILVAYGRVWVAAGGGLASPSGALLVDFGGRWPPMIADEPWRLVTAVFLHGGLLHLGFNCLAIASIGPRIEEVYGKATMLGLFIVTATLANLGALEVGRLAVGVGASGGVMGLIGVAAAYGHRAGTSRGRDLRDATLKWAAYTFMFGFWVGADNWAHLFGLLAGAAFGLAVTPEAWARPRLVALRLAMGMVGLVATVGAVAIICSRTPSPPEDGDQVAAQSKVLRDDVTACTALYAGHTDLALSSAEELLEPPAGQTPAQFLTATCESLQQIRDRCKELHAERGASSDENSRDLCDDYRELLNDLPARPTPTAPADAADGRRE